MASPIKTVRGLNVAIKSYIDAKHNMTTAQIRVAVTGQEERVRRAQEELDDQTEVLRGYRQALVEREKK